MCQTIVCSHLHHIVRAADDRTIENFPFKMRKGIIGWLCACVIWINKKAKTFRQTSDDNRNCEIVIAKSLFHSKEEDVRKKAPSIFMPFSFLICISLFGLHHTRIFRWSERQIRVGQECQTYSEWTCTHIYIYPTNWKCHSIFCIKLPLCASPMIDV